MAFERTLPQAIAPLSANGANGYITVADTTGFFVKCKVLLTSNTQPNLSLEIKRIVVPNTIYVGLPGPIGNRTDCSAYLVSDNATIDQFEQQKPSVPIVDQEAASWAGDPIVARRVIPVDTFGTPYGKDNPVPVNADVTVNTVQLFTLPYDSIQASYPSATVETYSTYIGGLSGTLVQTATVTYTDNTKNFIQSVVRTPLN